MDDSTKAKIFLASERGVTETDWFRGYNTFHFGRYQKEHKTPFGALYLFNDDTLDAGRAVQLMVETDSIVVLVPVVGAIRYADTQGNELLLQAGEAAMIPLPANAIRTIDNPYEQGLINYLEFWFHCPAVKAAQASLAAFDTEGSSGLSEVFNFSAGGSPFSIRASIGKFAGREECLYKLDRSGNGLFVVVIEGAFEVQYRLLEARDALALWDLKEADMEALSNEAVLLIFEMPLP